MSHRQALCNELHNLCIKHNMAVHAIEYDTAKANVFIRVDNKEKFVDCASIADDDTFKKQIAQAIKSMQKGKTNETK